MNIGQLIKLERQRQNMKQEVLASGICVPSYLSRIENGLVIPSEDIQQHLLKRLNISKEKLNNELSEERLFYFKSFFKTVINTRNKEKAEELYEEITFYIEAHPMEPNRLTLLLMETRLMLMIPAKRKEVQSHVAILEEFKKEMNTEQLFYLHTIQGILAYMNNQFRNASDIFNEVFTLIKSYRMEDWEMAELYYISSLSLLSESRYILAIDYVKSALSYFNQEILIERSIECLIILGIAQKDNGVLLEAVATYKKAKEISSKIESSRFLGKIEHNLGKTYSLLKDKEKSLFHFQQSLTIKNTPSDIMITIFSLLFEYHKYQDFDNAKIWLEKGLNLLDQLPEKQRTFYSNHFIVYKLILFNEKNVIPTFKKVIDYFESVQEYKYCSIYCYILGKKLASEKQYKQATIFYEQGFKYYLKLSKVSTWEELL